MSRERAIWAAVMRQAIHDVKSNDDGERESAKNWINNRKNTEIGSFIWVCNAIGFDPDKTRRRIFERVEKEPIWEVTE